MPRQLLRMRVNGRDVEVLVRPYDVLLDVLRENLNLVGTKRGCDMGTCGCCTVHIDGRARLSCLTIAAEAEGRDVTTIEGLVTPDGLLHPLQECWAQAGASQCGFCSPGFLMASSALLRDRPRATRGEIEDAISGNVCRCTGFVKIVEAVETARDRLLEEQEGAP